MGVPSQLGPVLCTACHLSTDNSPSTCKGCGNEYHARCLAAGCVAKGCGATTARPGGFAPWHLAAASLPVCILAAYAGAAPVGASLWRAGFFLLIASIWLHLPRAVGSRFGSVALAIWSVPLLYVTLLAPCLEVPLELTAGRLRLAWPGIAPLLDHPTVAAPQRFLADVAAFLGLPLALFGLVVDRRRLPALLALSLLVPYVSLLSMVFMARQTSACSMRCSADDSCGRTQDRISLALQSYRPDRAPSSKIMLDEATWKALLNSGHLTYIPRDAHCGWGSFVHYTTDPQTGQVRCSRHRRVVHLSPCSRRPPPPRPHIRPEAQLNIPDYLREKRQGAYVNGRQVYPLLVVGTPGNGSLVLADSAEEARQAVLSQYYASKPDEVVNDPENTDPYYFAVNWLVSPPGCTGPQLRPNVIFSRQFVASVTPADRSGWLAPGHTVVLGRLARSNLANFARAADFIYFYHSFPGDPSVRLIDRRVEKTATRYRWTGTLVRASGPDTGQLILEVNPANGQLSVLWSWNAPVK